MNLKLSALAALLFAATIQQAWADPTRKLMGLSEEDLISCAGIPLASMSSGRKTFYQFGDVSEVGGLFGTGDGDAIYAKKQKGCVATITVENGIVSKVSLKKRGWISGPLACDRIFSGCN